MEGPELRHTAASSGDAADVAPEGIDPWSATFEEALASSQPLDIARWGAAFEVTRLREAVTEGSGRAVLDAVARCASHSLAMPRWLELAFLDRYRRVALLEVESWDEAFGSPKTKGRLEKKRKHHAFHWPVLQTVISLLQEDRARGIDKDLFADVAARLGDVDGLKGTVCMEIYFEAKKRFGIDPGKLRKSAVRRTGR